jgi:hypothetical protein
MIDNEIGVKNTNIMDQYIKHKGFNRNKGPNYNFLQSLKELYPRNGKWVFVHHKPGIIPGTKKWFTLKPFSREEAKYINSTIPELLEIFFDNNYSVPRRWKRSANVDQETKQEIDNYVNIIKTMSIDRNSGNVFSTHLDKLQNDNKTVIDEDDEDDEIRGGNAAKQNPENQKNPPQNAKEEPIEEDKPIHTQIKTLSFQNI